MRKERVRVYEVDGGYVVAEYDCWVVGTYETDGAARIAANADPLALADLVQKNLGKRITVDDLRALTGAEG